MSQTAINILIGGEAGQGLATIGQLMSKALVRAGYEIHVAQEYYSRIRGGHNTFSIRTGPEPIHAPTEDVDILVALDDESLTLHADQLTERAVVIAAEGAEYDDGQVLKVPFSELAPKKIFHNVVALGVLGRTICKDIKVLEKLLQDTFGKKGEEVVGQNIEVLRKAYDWVGEQEYEFACMPPAEGDGDGRIMLTGNEAIALGALAAGCDFCSFYPMTPATSVALTLIAKGGPLGLVAEQAEDEIAAVNMGLGASFAGATALVPTSGGGFALMVEGVSLAGMTETPLVFVLAQRPGPATGLPTRTEQGDLNMVLHAGHGDFPRAIFAPGDIEEAFFLTHRAFDMAEKHQSPAFVLTDQYLADSYRAVTPFNLDELPEVARPVLEPDNPEDYKRYALTDSGVSPRVVPGFSKALVRADSDEHDEGGFINEEPDNRLAHADKRMRKAVGLSEDVVAPELFGNENADVLLVCWGSTLGPALEAMETMDADVAVLHFKQLWPLVEDQFMDTLEGAGRVVAVEGNATGQFADILRRETGFHIQDKVLRYDGYPFTARFIIQGLEDIL